ncbi:hypothetical protein ABZ766_26815 [Streptomyces sp. NPDC006670]|uniref:hypothetical protein n=1 Tax=Streptomyces sp. NPDC006670 TaxID=3154476 RepID=UPI0033CA6008
MTYDYGTHLDEVLTVHYGMSTGGWPPSAKYVAPLFAGIVNAVDLEEATELFEASIQAHRRETDHTRDRGRGRDFAGYLALQLPRRDDPSMAETAAWLLLQTIHQLAQHDDAGRFETYLACALEACERCQRRHEPVRTTATA